MSSSRVARAWARSSSIAFTSRPRRSISPDPPVSATRDERSSRRVFLTVSETNLSAFVDRRAAIARPPVPTIAPARAARTVRPAMVRASSMMCWSSPRISTVTVRSARTSCWERERIPSSDRKMPSSTSGNRSSSRSCSSLSGPRADVSTPSPTRTTERGNDEPGCSARARATVVSRSAASMASPEAARAVTSAEIWVISALPSRSRRASRSSSRTSS